MQSKTNNFNRLVPFYDLLAKLVFFNRVQISQRAFIDYIPKNAQVLFIGGGSNSSLAHILDLNPSIKIIYLEASKKMLQKARSKVNPAHLNRVTFICGTELDIPMIKFDVVICYYYLDLFKLEKLNEVLSLLKNKTKPNGIWMVADFSIPFNWWQKWLSQLMFLFFRLTSHIENNQMIDLNAEMEKQGFQRIKLKKYYRKQIFSAIYKNVL